MCIGVEHVEYNEPGNSGGPTETRVNRSSVDPRQVQ